MTIIDIEKNILKLPPAQRLRLIENVIASLNKPDPNIERAWAKESDKRLKAYKKGTLKGIDLQNVRKHFNQ